MLNLLAFVAFVGAAILIAADASFLIAPLGWIAVGLALQAAGGAYPYVASKRPKR